MQANACIHKHAHSLCPHINTTWQEKAHRRQTAHRARALPKHQTKNKNKKPKMPTTDLLQTFGLSKNPFTDRTAENTAHDATSLYVHSDLRGFAPNESTYVFFGRRGR
jgi:hypothetical protein